MFVDTFRRFVKTSALLCFLISGVLGSLAVGSIAASASSKSQTTLSKTSRSDVLSVTRRVFSAKSDELEIPMDDATPTPTIVVLKSVTLTNAVPTPVSDASEALIDTDIPVVAEATATPTKIAKKAVSKPDVVVETIVPTPEETNESATPISEGPKETVVEIATKGPEASQAAVAETSTPTSTDTATATYTPTVETVVQQTTPTSDETSAVGKSRNVIPGKRVGLSPEWFDFLIQAGYLVRSSSDIPKFGTIAETAHPDEYLMVGMHLVVSQSSKETVKVGDRLMVYRVLDGYVAPETKKSLGRFVKNLGILVVTRTGSNFVQADVVSVFAPFMINESVKPFEDELDRWKQSRRRKPLPADPIDCAVAGLPSGLERALMNDTVILSAGEDQGVVAGMDFEIQKPVEASVGKKVWVKTGKARVFFVGGKYSMAKIVWNRDLILCGFRAQYQP